MKEYISELCGMCGSENTIEWDVEKEGYEAFCPRCGRKMMLCDASMHSEDNRGMKCPMECMRYGLINKNKKNDKEVDRGRNM